MGQETIRKRASLCFTSSQEIESAPNTQGSGSCPPCFQVYPENIGLCCESSPTFPAAALIQAEASTALLKVSVPKNLKMKLTEQWEQPKGRASSLFSSAPEEPGTRLACRRCWEPNL